MDKLQPLIKHRYWIIFSLATIFVVVGWWMASGAIATATEARRKSVDDSFTKASQGKNEPNADWVKQAQERNALDEKSKLNAAKMLWQRQQSARRWPESLAKDFQSVPFMGEVKEVQTRRKWKRVYKTQIEDLLKLVNPYDPKTKEGLVAVTINSIDHEPFAKWRYQEPVSTEIWTCQEDIWLMQSLLTSIARVNGEAKRITEGNVRKINRLSLRGGDPAATPPEGGGGAGGGMGGMSGEGMMSGGMAGMGAMGEMGAMGGGAGAANYPGKEFEGNSGGDILAEEFGAVAGGGGGMGGPMGGMGSTMGDGAGADSAGAAVEEDRYVDEKEGQYKTRAFLLDVIVRDDQLPNLLASLTNSDFPVEIRRVEVLSGVNSSGGSAGSGMDGMTMGGGGMGGLGSEGGSGSEFGMGASSGLGMTPGGMGMTRGGMGMTGGGGMDMAGSDPGMGMPGMGMSGMGMSGMGMSGMGMSGMGAGGQTSGASDPLVVAMADPLLVTVKIGGLMTLYQSLAETTAQEETEKAAEAEQTTKTTPDPSDPSSSEQGEEMQAESPAEGAPIDGSIPEPSTDANNSVPNGGEASTAGEIPSTKGTPPVEGEAKPADGSSADNSGQPSGTNETPASPPAEASSDGQGNPPSQSPLPEGESPKEGSGT